MSLVFLVLGCLAIGVATDMHSHVAMLAGGLLLALGFGCARSNQPSRAVTQPQIEPDTLFLSNRRSRAPTAALDLPLRI